MEVKIERVENGFIVSYLEEWDDGTKHQEKKVFEENDNTNDENQSELSALRNAFLEIKEQLGYFYSKHNKVNLVIELETNEKEESK